MIEQLRTSVQRVSDAALPVGCGKVAVRIYRGGAGRALVRCVCGASQVVIVEGADGGVDVPIGVGPSMGERGQQSQCEPEPCPSARSAVG